MRLLCPAKINLHLRVGPIASDGFHPLLSWFCAVGLFDTLTLSSSGAATHLSDVPQIRLRCDDAGLPCDERNLVVKIGQAFAQDSIGLPGASVGSVEAFLQKRIPAGAGLGGGSSNGARMLQGLDALWKTRRAANYLSGFAARIGSDLPFFFHGPSSICTGRGERVRPVAPPACRWALLALPPIAMPTAQVYRQFDLMKLGRSGDIELEPDWKTWAKYDARELLTLLVNDLEPAAFEISPALGALRKEMELKLARPVRMSGSGSSLFTLFDSREEADASKVFVGGASRVRAEVVELAPDFQDALNASAGAK